MDVVAEELRTSGSPVVLAGAARAVRGLGADAGEEWAGLLRDAAERIATVDVYVRWQPGVVPPTWLRTARGEVLAVLEEVRGRAASLAVSSAAGARFALDRERLRSIGVEDQSGASSTLGELLADRKTILAFFYTRCMNPARCSLTITRLAALARSRENDRAVLAITYDPDFDSPERMRRYGADRGFPFGERARLIRTADAWPEVRAMFGLRVGYGPVTVNEHARELFLIREDLSAEPLEPDAIASPAAELMPRGSRG
jgi:hypothetical protein